MKTIFLFTIILLQINFVHAQWQSCNLDSVNITGLSNVDTRIFAGTLGGVHVSNDFGDNWSFMPISPFYSVCELVANGNTFFAATNNGLRMSTNNGANWSAVNALINFQVHSVILHGADVFTASYFGVHLSTNNGVQWNFINNGLPQTSGAEIIVASGASLFAVADSTVFISTNYGGLWTLADSGLNNTKVYSLAIFGSSLFAGTENGMFISTNNGGLWTAVNNGFPVTIVRSIAISGTHIFAATDSGVYYSGDNGAAWTSIQSNLPANKVSHVAICGNKLFVSLAEMASGGELWSRPLLQVTGLTLDESLSSFSLYPNPVSGKLYLTGDASKILHAEFYNALGARIQVENENNTFDLSSFSKGVYFMKFDDGEKMYTRKIVVE